jgi:CBS domain
MKVKEAMHKGVEWVGPDTPVTELAKLMCTYSIGAIPIGENDRLIGMVTDRDIVCKGLVQDGFDVHRATARDARAANCPGRDGGFLRDLAASGPTIVVQSPRGLCRPSSMGPRHPKREDHPGR